MIADALGGDGPARHLRCDRQPPGPQHVAHLEHQVPVECWMVVLEDDKTWHEICSAKRNGSSESLVLDAPRRSHLNLLYDLLNGSWLHLTGHFSRIGVTGPLHSR